MKLVLKVQFEGDVFEVHQHATDRYQWFQKSGDELVASGETLMLSKATEAVFDQINSWALDIDTGDTEAGGI